MMPPAATATADNIIVTIDSANAEAIIPHLPPFAIEQPNKKKTKRDCWNDEMIQLSQQGLLILNTSGQSLKDVFEANSYVQCVPCRDGRGKSLGFIHLRCPFDPEKWKQHECGKKHQENMQQFIAMKELRTEGKLKRTKQTGIFAFFKSRTASQEVVINEAYTGLQRYTEPSIPPARSTDCCGIYNSLKGDYTKTIGKLHKYLAIKDRKYEFGQVAGLPSLRSSDCTGHGLLLIECFGRVCQPCLELRQENGNSNPREYVKKWSDKLDKVFERRTRPELTKSDINDAKKMMRTRVDYFTEEGLILREEAKAQVEYYDRMMQLNKVIPKESYNLSSTAIETTAVGPDNFLRMAHVGECSCTRIYFPQS